MKRKIMTQTYLRDVSKYQIKMYFDEDDCYVIAKKMIQVDKKFILKNNLCVMDNNYYVLEIVPKNENYALRVFLSPEGKPLEYYFDICKNNGLDSQTMVPFYDDLYLDITVSVNNIIRILDRDELEDALKKQDISEEDYQLVEEVKEELLKQIKSKTNKLMNMDYMKYLF